MFDPNKRGVFSPIHVVKKRKSMRRVELEVALAIVLAVIFVTFLCHMANR